MAPVTFAALQARQRCSRVSGQTSRNAAETERAITDRQLGRCGKAARLQVTKQVCPALGVLPQPVHDRQDVLPATGIGADDHQHALAIPIEAWFEIDPVCPEMDMVLACQVLPAPGLVLLPPAGLQPAGGPGGQPLGIRTRRAARASPKSPLEMPLR